MRGCSRKWSPAKCKETVMAGTPQLFRCEQRWAINAFWCEYSLASAIIWMFHMVLFYSITRSVNNNISIRYPILPSPSLHMFCAVHLLPNSCMPHMKSFYIRAFYSILSFPIFIVHLHAFAFTLHFPHVFYLLF